MIVVLGPAWLAAAVTEAHLGELVVSGNEDPRLFADATLSADLAAVLPLPARACVVVVAEGGQPEETVDAVRAAGGALRDARVLVAGPPPSKVSDRRWRQRIAGLGAISVINVDEVGQALTQEAASPSRAERRAMRPGAPEAAAWRDALRSAKPRRLRFRRRPPVERKYAERELDAAIRRPLSRGCHFVAVISPKGGVGKTFLSFLTGSTLAAVRGDRVVVVDTNPDFGTLADLVSERVPATISDLLAARGRLRSDEDVANFCTTTRTGMQILAAPQDPAEMRRLGRDGYEAVSDILAEHYDLVIFDCGTGFLDDITQFALGRADQVVLVSAPQLVTTKIVMGAADALATMRFDLSRATFALNMLRGDEPLNRASLRTALVGRAAGVVEIPHDDRLRLALDLGEFDYARLNTPVRQSVKRLAAEVVSRMPGPLDTMPARTGDEPVRPPTQAREAHPTGPARAAAKTTAGA